MRRAVPRAAAITPLFVAVFIIAATLVVRRRGSFADLVVASK
jgi:hypothetical protein